MENLKHSNVSHCLSKDDPSLLTLATQERRHLNIALATVQRQLISNDIVARFLHVCLSSGESEDEEGYGVDG